MLLLEILMSSLFSNRISKKHLKKSSLESPKKLSHIMKSSPKVRSLYDYFEYLLECLVKYS